MVRHGAPAVTASPPKDGVSDDGSDATLVTASSPTEPSDGQKPPRNVRKLVLEWGLLIVAALVIAFVIKTFLFQAFYIPSSSMVPTLQVGDRVLVNKLSYDFHDVDRGDIVVFEAPASARTEGIEDLVKRVIGLPGESVTYGDDGAVYVDGRRLREPYLPAGTTTIKGSQDVPPGCDPPPNGAPGCVVPAGHLFMMGDNRGESKDTREFGPIPEDTIVGRVFVRIWPIGDIKFF